MEYVKFKCRELSMPPTYSGVDPDYTTPGNYFVWTGASGTLFPDQDLTSRMCLRTPIGWYDMNLDEIDAYNAYLGG